jgi:hypothetical protein
MLATQGLVMSQSNGTASESDKKRPSPGCLILIGVAAALVALIFFFPSIMAWVCGLPAAIATTAIFAWLLWHFTFRYNSVLFVIGQAQGPLQMVRRGEKLENAEKLFQKLLARARSFPNGDLRGAVMLSELAKFSENRGRRIESASLHRECIDALEKHEAHEPILYLCVLSNFGVFLTHGRDFRQAERMLERAVQLLPYAERVSRTKKCLLAEELTNSVCATWSNLAFLHLEMNDLNAVARDIQNWDANFNPSMSDHAAESQDAMLAVRAFWHLKKGEIIQATDACMGIQSSANIIANRVRVKLHLASKEYAAAANLLEVGMQNGLDQVNVLRPEYLELLMDYAECLYQQQTIADAFKMMNVACVMVQHHRLPRDEFWRKAVELWQIRAREHEKSDLLVTLEAERRRIPENSDHGIMTRTHVD